MLTGMLEDLRRQTQSRLDFEFAGRESQIFLSNDAAIKNIPLGVARYGRDKSITQFTSVNSDFSAPLLKKSVDFGADKIKHLLLLLDDEADNASINTKKNYYAEQFL
ncbi:MAG: hypothetical protein SR1Q7_06565 [Quinella sp. 1Q7]|nr:hypothetical protein [Quinella sp. 1Q7]